MSDIGNLTWGIRDNMIDVCEAWNNSPAQFRERELSDLRAAHRMLSILIEKAHERDALRDMRFRPHGYSQNDVSQVDVHEVSAT